jgi:hypothetical protein
MKYYICVSSDLWLEAMPRKNSQPECLYVVKLKLESAGAHLKYTASQDSSLASLLGWIAPASPARMDNLSQPARIDNPGQPARMDNPG